jgi:hypothetical protein
MLPDDHLDDLQIRQSFVALKMVLFAALSSPQDPQKNFVDKSIFSSFHLYTHDRTEFTV